PAGEERIPLRGVRRAIAAHLLKAHQQTAPCTYVEEADFTELVRLREKVQPLAEQRGVRLTFLPFVIAAACAALKEHPRLNAVMDEETGELVVKRAHHIGIAAQTDQGLLVPVIRDADQRHILDLAAETHRLAEAARAGKLSREELSGGTFSITSLGPLGGLLATPIINTPQVAILGMHKIAPRPVARDGQVVIRQMANLSLTFDHRYIDGAVGAAFAATLIKYLEDPAVLLFSLAEFHHR
ncbi:MAG: 2-oxo acid dehydrogenase subunit E2, partial [Armatimonadetes bacterium]|nr:2-oxo acid dehydrogenase subunit E2 [Armatimonadota bacterium]